MNLGPLPDGTYRLVETKAPAGYNKLADEITITVSNNGANITVSDGLTVTNPSAASNVGTITVPNSSAQALPNTGGIGTVIFTVLGVVLVVGAALALMLTRNRRRG